MSQLPKAKKDVQRKKGVPRTIHIWEFPQWFWVQLEPDLIRDLVDRAAKSVGGINQLARMLNVYDSTIYRYRNQDRPFILIRTLQKFCNLAGDSFPIEVVEPAIMAYKGHQRAIPIRNPNLPLIETPDLFAFMGHMAGDGGHHKSHAYYDNTQEVLIHNFKRLLQSVFGEVPVHVAIQKKGGPRNNPSTRIRFGMTIVNLLHHLYNVNFRTHTARVPRHLFGLPTEYTRAYLRAFGDDEGTVLDGSIRLCSSNKPLLHDVYKLIQTKYPDIYALAIFETTNRTVNTTWKDMHTIRFRIGAVARYQALIGFDHPEKQQELDTTLTRRKRGWSQRKAGVTRRKILEVLRTGSMTAKNLAKILEITAYTIRQHLKYIIGLGVVRVQDELDLKKARVFEITDLGRKFLQLPTFGLLATGGRKYRTKMNILQHLARGEYSIKTLQQKLEVNNVWPHVIGRRAHGKWYPGLIELGFVHRVGKGTCTDPHVYSLTTEGRRITEELQILFPSLFTSD